MHVADTLSNQQTTTRKTVKMGDVGWLVGWLTETETETKTDRQRQRQKQGERQIERDRDRERRKTDRQTDRQRQRQRQRQRDTDTDTDSQADRQTDCNEERQPDKKAHLAGENTRDLNNLLSLYTRRETGKRAWHHNWSAPSKAEMGRGLRMSTRTCRPLHHSTDRLNEMGVDKGRDLLSTLPATKRSVLN